MQPLGRSDPPRRVEGGQEAGLVGPYGSGEEEGERQSRKSGRSVCRDKAI